MVTAKNTLSEAERFDWLRLIRSENVGPRTFFQLIDHLGTAAAALDAAPELSRRGGRKRAIRIADPDRLATEMEALDQADARMIALCEPDYPEALAAIHDPPPLITVRGNVSLLSRRSVGMVGARNASAGGCRFAREMAAGLGAGGLSVISGMARGIDTASHEGALATGTVAVLAGGVDNTYPPENAELHERIAAEGAVISEQPMGLQPTARHFPPRNRLISGLALGVLVVEAAPRSGSLITARMALEQGREVFAVPGSPRDPRALGANKLIREGATLTESAEDVIEALNSPLQGVFEARATTNPDYAPPISEPDPLPDGPEIDNSRENIVEKLSSTPVTVDELVRECQLSARIVQGALLELELAGRIERHPGNRISLLL
jgi:DNA processing protein